MSARVLQAVPNFSEGRDPDIVRALADTVVSTGAYVLDWSMDADHNRSVITVAGEPSSVESALVAAAALAVERIDLRQHSGVHPRIGAVDVAPVVPLVGVDMDEARQIARDLGRRLAAEVRLPVFFYAAASSPPGRTLAELRRGGFESLVDGWPPDRQPDVLPDEWQHPGAHPTAGAVCVGARPPMLAWNVYLDGVPIEGAREMARTIRQSGGGFRGLRALAFELPVRGRIQISMNLEDLSATRPIDVRRRIEELAEAAGGRAGETEVIGMLPDELVLSAAADRLELDDDRPERLLSRWLSGHLARSADVPLREA